MSTKWADPIHIMPLPRRPLAAGWDASVECWTLTRDDGKGQIHIAYVPWLFRFACPCGSYVQAHRYIAEWMPFPTHRHPFHLPHNWQKYCKHCIKTPSLPWEMLLPAAFDPPATRDEAAVIADWWADCGETARERAIRHWVEAS